MTNPWKVVWGMVSPGYLHDAVYVAYQTRAMAHNERMKELAVKDSLKI
jgi:hypothetical protein